MDKNTLDCQIHQTKETTLDVSMSYFRDLPSVGISWEWLNVLRDVNRGPLADADDLRYSY